MYAAQVRLPLDERVLAGEPDGQPLLRRNFPFEFVERFGKLVDRIVRFPGAAIDNLQANAAIAFENLRGVGNPAAEPFLPHRTRRPLVFVDHDSHPHHHHAVGRLRVEPFGRSRDAAGRRQHKRLRAVRSPSPIVVSSTFPARSNNT